MVDTLLSFETEEDLLDARDLLVRDFSYYFVVA